MEVGESGLQRQDAHQQQRRAIHSGHAAVALRMADGCIDDTPCEVRERQGEQATREQRDHRGAEPPTIGAEVPEKLQRLPERFPIQLRFGEFDSRLIVA